MEKLREKERNGLARALNSRVRSLHEDTPIIWGRKREIIRYTPIITVRVLPRYMLDSWAQELG